MKRTKKLKEFYFGGGGIGGGREEEEEDWTGLLQKDGSRTTRIHFKGKIGKKIKFDQK